MPKNAACATENGADYKTKCLSTAREELAVDAAAAVRSTFFFYLFPLSSFSPSVDKHLRAGTYASYVLDPRGQPLLRLRADAVHTANLVAQPRCSLFVQPPDRPGRLLARATLIGVASPLSCEESREAAERHAALHGEGSRGVDAPRGDDLYYRLGVETCFYVAGLGGASGAPPPSPRGPDRDSRDFGRRLEVEWDGDGAVYCGTVIGSREKEGAGGGAAATAATGSANGGNGLEHFILYDAGDEEWLDLSTAPHRWLDGGRVDDRARLAVGDAAVERRAAAAAAAAAAEAEAELQEQQQLHLQQRDGSSGGEVRGGGANGKRPRDRRGERARLKKRKASMVSFDFFLPQQKLVR